MSLRAELGVATGMAGIPNPIVSSYEGPPLTVITTLEVVGYDEHRHIEAVKEPGAEKVKYLAAESGTLRASIYVRTSKGHIFRIPIDSYILEDMVEGIVQGEPHV